MTLDASSPQLLSFDTELLPPDDRMDRYRTLYSSGAEVTATGPAPRAAFQGWRLDRAVLYERRLNDIGHYRAAGKLEQYGLSHWTVTLVLDGWIGFDLGAGLQRIKPGEVLLVDTNTVGRNDARNAHIVTLSIAQDRLEAIMGPLGCLHGYVIPVEDGRLYANFVRSLLAILPTLPCGALPTLTSTLGMILRAALDVRGQASDGTLSTRHARRLAVFRTLVDARLADAAFGTEAAVQLSGFSRATLYRLLRPHGGLSTIIQDRRLEKIRRCLSDTSDLRALSVLVREAGFHDESHASRAFTARFGIRPSAYRAAVTQTDDDGRFRAWQQDLH